MDDLISRRAAIKAIDDLPNCYNGYSDTYDKAYIIGTLEEVPSAEKHGKWIAVEHGLRHECSLCHEYAPSYRSGDEHLTDYCPNCGARMDG